VSDYVNDGRDQSIRAPAPASSAVGPTRPAPPRRRSTHRSQTKQTCAWWRDTLIMDAIDTKPANAAGRVQPLCVPCAGAPLHTAPLSAAAARRRPAVTCMQFTCAHSQLRPRAPASFLYAPHEILQAPGRPASSHGFDRVAQSRHAQDRPGAPRRVTGFNQPAFDNVRHKRYHKRLPLSRNGPKRARLRRGAGCARTRTWIVSDGTCIAVFPILADPDKNNLQSAQLLIGREVVSGRMDGCRASVLHSCSCRDRPKLGRLQYIC